MSLEEKSTLIQALFEIANKLGKRVRMMGSGCILLTDADPPFGVEDVYAENESLKNSLEKAKEVLKIYADDPCYGYRARDLLDEIGY